jgi:TPR repeat protein
MMVQGRGGPVDSDTGVAWLEKAAASGHTFAQIHLLAIKEGKAKSIFEKVSIRMKRIPLLLRWLRERSSKPSPNKGG